MLLLDIPDNFISYYGVITHRFFQRINLVWRTKKYVLVYFEFFYVIDAINDIYPLSYFAVVRDPMCYEKYFLHGVPLLTRQVAFVAMLQLYKVKGELCYIVISHLKLKTSKSMQIKINKLCNLTVVT